MNFNRSIVAAVLLASSVAFALPAHAARGGGGSAMHEMHGGPGMRMLRQLELSEAQRDQVFRIFHEQAPAARERMKAVQAAREQLRTAALDPNVDAARLRELADASGAAHAQAAVQRAETMRRVSALLSPEQRARLAQPRGRGGHGGHGGRR